MGMKTKKAITPKSPLKDKIGSSSIKTTQLTEITNVEINEADVDAVLIATKSLGYSDAGLEELATKSFKMLGMENGELTPRGLNRVRGAIKFLCALLGGKRHKDALKESGLTWAQVSAFTMASEEFNAVYQTARGKMKMAMGMSVLDTAFELATEGDDFYFKGEVVGKKKSEKMLDRLMVLAGKEFSKDVGKNAKSEGSGNGGITLNFHFDGKKPSVVGEVVDV